MVETLLIVIAAITFFLSIMATKWWINAAKRANLTGKDMNKINRPTVAELGGLPVVAAFLFGLLIYIGIKTFFFDSRYYTTEILAVAASVLLIALVGIIDDILGWRIGLKQWQKPILCLSAALMRPLQ